METTSKIITGKSKLLLVLASILLAVSIFIPIWRIDLDAPQYPEGLRLFIYADKLGGNVDIINGLNHYIGMKTLHADDFIEFTILPYLIGFFALLTFITALAGRKRLFYFLFTGFVLFGIIAMADFWRWEYDYGHNLDPTAAIIVPGMAYQPPLIGFKQLLNFGAYSVPSYGGWFFVVSGLLMLIVLLIETNIFKSKKMKTNLTVLILPLLFLLSCSEAKPEKAKLNVDNCDYCKMTIADEKFVAEIITPKGRLYKFDDVVCMKNYVKDNESSANSSLYITNFEQPGTFLKADEAAYVTGDVVISPMGGNLAAFTDTKAAEAFAQNNSVQIMLWKDIK